MVIKEHNFYLNLKHIVDNIINYKKRDGIPITHRYRKGNQVAYFVVAFFILRTQVVTNTSVPTILKHGGTTKYRS